MGKQDGPLMGTGRAASMHNVTVVLKQHSVLCGPPLNTHTHTHRNGREREREEGARERELYETPSY